MYLEDFKVYIPGYFSPLDIPGLKDVIQNAFRTSDIAAFKNDHKTFFPFKVTHYDSKHTGNSYTGKTFEGFIETFASLIPHSPRITQAVYSIVLNPDIPQG